MSDENIKQCTDRWLDTVGVQLFERAVSENIKQHMAAVVEAAKALKAARIAWEADLEGTPRTHVVDLAIETLGVYVRARYALELAERALTNALTEAAGLGKVHR